MSKIVDAWVYTDNDLEGAFELPASFPVLKSGQSIIRIQPGIKLNGIAETRAPYPFFDTISIPASLTRENELELETLTASYKASTVFAWMEDFEDPSISMDTTNRSDVKLVRVVISQPSPVHSREKAMIMQVRQHCQLIHHTLNV